MAPNLVNGKVKEEEPQPVQLVTVKFPIAATFALKLVVEARPETKKSEAVAFWSVEEARARKLLAYKLVPVAEVEKSAWKVEEAVAKRFPV